MIFFLHRKNVNTITNLKINLITNMIHNTYAISFCRYGVTGIHVSDNGTEFVNMVAQDLYNCSGVQHHVTLPYHPPGKWPCGKTE